MKCHHRAIVLAILLPASVLLWLVGHCWMYDQQQKSSVVAVDALSTTPQYFKTDMAMWPVNESLPGLPFQLEGAANTSALNHSVSLAVFDAVVSKKWRTLSYNHVKAVKKFVLFVGYTRSGHSIIGTLMDAHPHVVISNEFDLFSQFDKLNKASWKTWKYNLFNMIFRKSVYDVWHSRANNKKGYQLAVKGLWQGRFDKYVEAIGDKSGDVTTRAYMANKTDFMQNFDLLKKRLKIPLRVIHAVRNPYDMIATSAVIQNSDVDKFRNLKRKYDDASDTGAGKRSFLHKFDQPQIVDGLINYEFRMFAAVRELIEKVFGRKNVLDVHNSDLVANPKETLSRIFRFLGVSASKHYLSVCAEKVFKNVSRSRHTIMWTKEQKEKVQRHIKEYKVLDRYTFTSD